MGYSYTLCSLDMLYVPCGAKKLDQIIFLITLLNLRLFWLILAYTYFNKFMCISYIKKRKTGNELKIHFVQLLADKNEYIDDSFVVV